LDRGPLPKVLKTSRKFITALGALRDVGLQLLVVPPSGERGGGVAEVVIDSLNSPQ
jgi:hypothetical protein